MASIDFTNLDEWTGELDKLQQKLWTRTLEELDTFTAQLTDDLRAAAPKPRKGARAATIFRRRFTGKRRATVDIGPTSSAFSLVFEEFGASNTPAKPWARPTLVAAWTAWRPWT